MKIVEIKRFEPGELTELEEEFYQRFSATAKLLAGENKDIDPHTLIAAVTRSLMQVAANALHLADHLGVDTDV